MSHARMERLRNIDYGEDRAWELATQLEQELAGEEHQFRRRARRLAERVRQDLKGVDVAYMRDEATMLAQQLKSHVQATDEGCIDIWEHMNLCLGKGTTSRKAKSKRLKLFPDERERIESEERDKPEHYQVPNVELIFSWDHNHQGRPRWRKRERTSSKQPDELPALSHHLKTELPEAFQAYRARMAWKESRRELQEGSGKRKREEFKQDDENNERSLLSTSPSAQQHEAGPAAKRRYQTDRGRRGGAAANSGKQKRATGYPSPLLYTEEPLKRRGKGRGSTYFSPAGRPTREPSMSRPMPSSFAVNQEEQTLASFEGPLQTGASASQNPINQPNFPRFDPRFTSSPTSIAPSAGPSTARPIYPALPAQSAVSYAQPHSAGPNTGSGRSYIPNASVAASGTGTGTSGPETVQQQGLSPIHRARTEPNARRTQRASPFTSPYQAVDSHAWSTPLLPHSYQQQVPASVNPRISQIQGDAAMTGRMPSIHQDPRSTGLVRSESSQGPRSPHGYGLPKSGNPSELNPTSYSLDTGTAPANVSTEHATTSLCTHVQPAEMLGAEPFPGFLDPGLNFEYRSELMASPPVHNPSLYNMQPTSATWPPDISASQNVASPASIAPPYAGSSHNDGTINPSTLAGPYYSSASTQQPAGQIYGNYEFMTDDNELLDLINQNLPPQAPPGPVSQQRNEPCSNPNCEPCRRLRNG
ncbi:hypothetical protein EV356DRAFT_535331 [Viridothelium virens]|uniref:Uncharacterized protein n=1 Tax=Viridothelium virens TaxID=1048519 RepID=A0A6A6H199_VIRVR|nr:hypothetical protein EV356DRAFT_535331 [Viridothelium virens]